MDELRFPSSGEDKQVVEVDLADIAPVDIDPTQLSDQGRRVLVEEVGRQGLPEPVYLAPASDGQEAPYRAISGQRFIWAAQAAGLEEVPAVVYPAEEVEAEVAQLVGRCRRTKRPLKRARLYEALMCVGGLSPTEVANKLGLGRSTIYRYISVLDLPDVLQRLVGDEDVSVYQALACAKGPPEELEQVVQAVLKQRLSTRDIEDLVSLVERFPGTPVSELAEEVVTRRTSRQAQAAESERSRPPQQPTQKAPIDYRRYTKQLSDQRREALEELAAEMQLDGVVVRRAALLLLADPRLITPSAVAYAQQLGEGELGRALTLVELGVERMRVAGEEGLTPNQRKVASLVLHHVGIWADEMLHMLQQVPTAVRNP